MVSKHIPSNIERMANTAERFLLLQGPLGGFFTDLAHWLKQQGKQVFKLNFNHGDEHDYHLSENTHTYCDIYPNFPDFLANFVQTHGIQAIVCFGDTRPYHRVAKLYCQQNDIAFWAFEEGYFRPNFVTLEQNGVNAFSTLPRNSDFFLNEFASLREQNYVAPSSVPGGFLRVSKHAARYYFYANLGKKRFPHYVHHRDFSISHYLSLWIQSGIKRFYYWQHDRHFAQRVEQGEFGRFFILPLQVFNDSQVRVHSDFSSIRNFLWHVLSSFNTHAPRDTQLIIKHHPMDRGFIDYKKHIDAFCEKYTQCQGRIFYVHDTPLPTLLRYGTGMVTLNSTAGLSALVHHMPVKVLGRANYDMAGITDQGSLAHFWTQPTPPDREIFNAYRQYHINVTQIHGNFYSTVHLPKHASN
ncbi:MAG: capsule polysaccharide modification protein [Neisseria sp.]|nr:capsule polysaccharide modification protein [Neisseria sp.]